VFGRGRTPLIDGWVVTTAGPDRPFAVLLSGSRAPRWVGRSSSDARRRAGLGRPDSAPLSHPRISARTPSAPQNPGRWRTLPGTSGPWLARS